MQDNIYKLYVTDEEYDFIQKLLQEHYNNLNKMPKDERLQYFRIICYENNLNFEKEINGTVYKVNTYFNENAEETILQKFLRITKKS